MDVFFVFERQENLSQGTKLADEIYNKYSRTISKTCSEISFTVIEVYLQ